MRTSTVFFVVLAFVASLFLSVDALIENLYCGKFNCYEVLQVKQDASKDEIGKSYRQLARKNHPDRFRNPDEKKEAEVKFRLIATAYETLKDDDQRADYNYMLENPDEFYRIYAQYYKRRMTPKVDFKIVVLVSVSVVSLVQYFVLWGRYKEAISYLVKDPKYRGRALQAAIREGVWDVDVRKKKGRTKEEIKEEEDAAVRQILESKMDIRGGYGKPTFRDILWVKIFYLPYTIYVFCRWYIRWTFRYVYQKLEFEEEDKLFLIRKHLKFSQTQFDALPEDERMQMYENELWHMDKFKIWKEEKDLKTKADMANNGRYKQYRRWIKKGGAGQISFGADE